MKVDLKDKVALVTGAAGGIGQAISRLMAQNGATVWYTDLDAGRTAAAAAEFSHCKSAAMDITNAAQIDAVMSRISAESGRLDILVNNAGVNTAKHRVTIDQFPQSEWDWIVNVDLNGPFMVSQRAIPLIAKSGGGRIVNIASIVGLVPLRLQCAFTAAKAGLINLTKAMALELAPKGILVNGVAPGSIMAEGTRKLFYSDDGMFKDFVKNLLAHIPLGRPGNVEEVAQAVLFLVDPENTYTTGHILTVDGGWTAGYARDF